MFDTSKDLTGLALLADEHTHELDPLCLSQRVEFLIAEMGHEGDTRLLDGFIAATLRGRDEDDLRIGGEHHLCVEVALHTDFHDAPVLGALEDIGVKEVLRTRQSFHYVVGIEDGEVRELQRRHTDGSRHRHLDAGIALRRFDTTPYEGEAVVLTHIDKPHACRVADGVASGITGLYELKGSQ